VATISGLLDAAEPRFAVDFQSPGEAQTFASQLQQYQALSGTGTYTFNAAPKFSSQPQDPIGNESSARFTVVGCPHVTSGTCDRNPIRLARCVKPALRARRDGGV
jgi:hypothetical protein